MRNFKLLLLKSFAVILALSSVLAVSAGSLFAAADVYPSKPVRLIVPTSPGGTQDLVARQIATKLSERLGKQVIVDNRSGAGQIIGTEIVANADPDGYTLLLPAGVHAIQAALLKLPYDAIKSFTPIALMASVSFALVVNPGVPANSVKELIALAKQKPGQLIFAATGVGVTPHMATELLKIMAGIDIKIVHFKGQGRTIPDLLGGHSHASINSIPGFLPHIKSGKLKVLGTTAAKRTASLPEVPTIAEAGVPGYETTSWYGILAPARTPAPIVDRLDKEIKAILALDEVKKSFLNDGLDMNYLGPTEFIRFIEGEIKNWEHVVKTANIKAE
jgi:tripartite-type tricarboxylate transporter receptor subunit TctC